MAKNPRILSKDSSLFFSDSHARGHPEGGGDGGEHGYHDVQNLAPESLVVGFHGVCLGLRVVIQNENRRD